MPWNNKTVEQRKEALIGANSVVNRNFKLTFSLRERQFLEQASLPDGESPYFKPIQITNDADWLLNHDEHGQTYESFWRSHITGKSDQSCLNDGGRDSRPQTAFSSRTQLRSRAASRAAANIPKFISIVPLGLFPGDGEMKNSKTNEFLIWLQTYCKAFFYNSKVEILQPLTISEVACNYRVNQLTGRFQLHAGDILHYLRKIKPKHAQCVIAVTMIDLYPKPSWDFVFGLASSTHTAAAGGVGVFSFARFDDVFYETWTQGSDQLAKTNDGKLSYSPFETPTKRVDGTDVSINDALLRRACNVMAHEIGHMFGLKHCVWMSCLMNGSNHLQESDNRPCHLCPVCLRKLQSVLDFQLMKRYQALREWMTPGFWRDYLHDPNPIRTESENTSSRSFLKSTMSTRRTSLPETFYTPVMSRGLKTASNKGTRSNRTCASARIISSVPEQTAFGAGQPLPSKGGRKAKHTVGAPPLLGFSRYSAWLDSVISFLSDSKGG